MDENTDYPVGGFVCDAVCPYCGELIKVNIPATPQKGYEIRANLKCPKCRKVIGVLRFDHGGWAIGMSK